MNMLPPDERRNLVLVYVPDQLDPADFREIGAAVRQRRPDIDTIVMNAERPDPHAVRKAARWPSLIVSQSDLRNFRPQRGKVYAGKPVNKAMQSKRLRDSGVPTPHTRSFIGNASYTEEEFGPFVMVKITRLGIASGGTGIKLMHTRNVAKYKYEIRLLEEKTRAPVLIQSFVDTGPNPCTYRVLTLFGETLYIKKRTLTRAFHLPVLETDVVTNEGMVTNIVRGKGAAHTELVREEDISALARQAAAAFPESPIIGVDILREAKTGKPYVIEMNIGNTWHFSSQSPGRFRGKALANHFNSWDVAADVLVAKTLAEAE
jgi:hypothetical protein